MSFLKLNAFQLKLIALITMTIDHYGYFIKPDVEIYRIIGRISFVIFAYFVANAYLYTSNKKKYVVNLLVFGVILDIILLLSNNYITSNIFITLAFGFILIYSYDTKKYYLGILILILTYFIKIDYGYYGIFMVLLSYLFYDKIFYLAFSNLMLCYLFYTYFDLSFIQVYSTIGVLLLMLYNHQQGLKAKYLFYIYYPAHIIVLNIYSMLLK